MPRKDGIGSNTQIAAPAGHDDQKKKKMFSKQRKMKGPKENETGLEEEDYSRMVKKISRMMR